jgi:hypothetical protein
LFFHRLNENWQYFAFLKSIYPIRPGLWDDDRFRDDVRDFLRHKSDLRLADRQAKPFTDLPLFVGSPFVSNAAEPFYYRESAGDLVNVFFQSGI